MGICNLGGVKTGTAQEADVRGGKTFMNSTGVHTGTATNHGNVTLRPSGNESVRSGSGFYDSVTADGSQSYNKGVNDADARVNTSSASYNSGYTNGVSSGKGTNANVTISGAAGGVYFSINLTVNSNGTVHVNSITRTGSGGNPYDFDGVRMGFTITGTDGSSVIARD